MTVMTTEELKINITVNSDDAESKLESLRSKITEIASLSEKGNFQHLGELSKSIKSMAGSADKLSGIAQSLKTISEHAGSFGKSLSGIKESKDAFNGMSRSIKNAKDALEGAEKASSKGGGLFSNLGTASFGDIAGSIVSDFKRIGSAGAKVAQIPFKMLFAPMQGLATRVAGLTQGFGHLFHTIGRVAFMRAIRGAIRMVTQALKEGVGAVYDWASAVGNGFVGTMNSITTSLTYFRNSIGAAISPILDAIAPVLDAVIDKCVAVINVFNQMIATLTGASTWRKAEKVATSFGGATNNAAKGANNANKAAKELKRTLLGFDEINRLDAPDSSSGSGSSGGGSGTGGNKYCRWLRFDPQNKKGLIIKEGTTIRLANESTISYTEDTRIDLTSDIDSAGTDYFVYIDNSGNISASSTYLNDNDKVKIGRFHTLCVNVGSNVTMTAPASANSGLTTSDTYLIKSYRQEEDPDFYAFYNKQIKSISANAKYDVVTVDHPLSGFTANDILPESVFCLGWYPDCLKEDAMVYDKNTDIVVDIYLQSGTGEKTASKYNATHTVNREAENHFWDLQQVGKKPLTDLQFTSIAIGGNECTNIVGSSDKGTVGGHADTAGRRMISAIGVEEACGYLWQWLENLVSWTDGKWNTRDGRGSFGQEYGNTYVLIAGGSWVDGSLCGSRGRASNNVRSRCVAGIGSRGSSLVIKKYNVF